MSKVITRFAPSPTGYLHIGGVRTALFNYLFTKKNSGKYILRIDDTDKERSKKEYEKDIIDGFKELGLNWDNTETIRQSERTEIYKKYIQILLDKGVAYISQEKEAKEGERAEVIRLKNPNKKVTFSDLIRGEVQFDTTELGDFVIAKSTDEPIYHFASVIDDFEMGITHVIRAEEHLSNTPRQILIQEAIGANRPIYAHIPIILAPDRSKLSKRHGATSLTDYLKMGYIPEAIINYLAFLGWNPGGEREIYNLQELIQMFDISKVQKAGAIFNIEKLNWYNRQYIIQLSDNDFNEKIKSFIPEWLSENQALLSRILPVLKEKLTKFSDLNDMLGPNNELSFINILPEYNASSLLWKKNPNKEDTKKHLQYVIDTLNTLEPKDFSRENIKNTLWSYVEENGKGDVLWPMRYAVTGLEKSPDPFVSAHILGKEETLSRLEKAKTKLSNI